MPRVSFRLRAPLDYKPLGREFAQARIAKGFTQSHVGFLTGISPAQISRIERGAGLDRVSFEDIVLLCRLFDVPPTDAAQKLGAWPVTDTTDVKANPKVDTMLTMIAEMPEDVRAVYLDMACKIASALVAGFTDRQGLTADSDAAESSDLTP